MARNALAVVVSVLFVGVPSEVLAQSSRLDTSGHVREEAYIRLPLSAADEKYAAIDGAA